MIGPDPKMLTGGITNVVRNYMDAGLDERVELKYISTTNIWQPGRFLLRKSQIFLDAYRQIDTLLSGYTIDLVHQHVSSGSLGFIRDWVLACLVSKYTQIPHFIHWHASSFESFFRNPLLRFGARKLLSQATLNIALSQKMADNLQALARSKEIVIRVIFNGVNLEEFAACRAVDRIKRGTKNILFMGRLLERKGIFDLINAISIVKSIHPEVELFCCGDGEIDTIRQLVKRNGLESFITLAGHIPYNKRAEWFGKADLFVLPSYAEGVPGSLLEAMAAQLPVIVTQVGGIPEITDENNALYLEPGNVPLLADHICSLLSDKELAVKMGAAGFFRVQSCYSIELIIGQLLSCYSEIVRGM
jgi:glycosyltransferase involved in cell wall biosynthesis